MTPVEPESGASSVPMSLWKKIVLGTILSVMVVSTAARAFVASGGESTKPQSELSSDLKSQGGSVNLPEILGIPGQTEVEPEPEPSSLEAALPYLSEGSFFALIGFALGYASKKIVKLMLIFLAIFFVGIQALSYGGVLSVDWQKFVDLLNDLILNLKENETLTEVLKDRVPTAGAMMAGYWLGFRRG